MKILVTGATGFLGKVLVQKLLSYGEKDIRCFIRDKNKSSFLQRITKNYPDANVEFFPGDLSLGEDATRSLEKIQILFHLASLLRASNSNLFLNNVVASKNLLEAAVKTRSLKRIVHISSLAVYKTADLRKNTMIDENTPLENHPEKRDSYTHSKLKQEKLFWTYFHRHNFELVVLRPGVIYGPGGTILPPRVGLQFPGLFLHMGGNNPLPLTYVENCAEAIVLASRGKCASGNAYNITDDDLPTSKEYLRMYRRYLNRIRYISIPFSALIMLSKLNQAYSKYSKGQLPAVLTTYKCASMWKKLRYDNSKIKNLGWRPNVATKQAIMRTFQEQATIPV